MIQLDCFIKALKLTWIRRMVNSDSQWKNLFTELVKCNLASFFILALNTIKNVNLIQKIFFGKRSFQY